MAVDRRRLVLREGPLSTCLVYDDRRHARVVLARLLAEVPGVQSVLAVASVDALALRHARDRGQVVFVGTRRAGDPGVDVIREVLALCPGAVVVAVGSREDAPTIGAAVAAGAAGFLRWDASPSLALTLIQSVTGPCPTRLPGPRRGRGCDHAEHPAARRELGISHARCRSWTASAEVSATSVSAGELDLSVNTVKSHVRKVFRRLGVHERAHAVARAHRFGLFACPDLPSPREEEFASRAGDTARGRGLGDAAVGRRSG